MRGSIENMKTIKILLGTFIVTLVMSTLNITATPLIYVGYVRNERVSGNGGTWETFRFDIDYENKVERVGYDWLYNTSVSRDVKVRVKNYYENNGKYVTPGYRNLYKDSDSVELSNENSNPAFIFHSGKYSLEFKTTSFQFGTTEIYNADWWVDNRL